MAKGSKNRTRDAPQSLPQVRSAPIKIYGQFPSLTEIQDLRTYDISPGTRPAKLFTGSTASLTYEPSSKKPARGKRAKIFHGQVAFNAPAETLVCIRRSRRKQVLFAKNKAGKRGQRKPRRSQWSSIKC